MKIIAIVLIFILITSRGFADTEADSLIKESKAELFLDLRYVLEIAIITTRHTIAITTLQGGNTTYLIASLQSLLAIKTNISETEKKLMEYFNSE